MAHDNEDGVRSELDMIRVLYEDDGVVVIDKPSGVMVHDDARTNGPTVVDWFLSHSPEAKGVGEPQHAGSGVILERSGVVHRLDRETSGVMVLAKTPAAFTHLKKQFHDRLVQKEYRAFVYGEMKEKWGTIDRPIGRSANDFRKRSAEPGSRGVRRPSVTDWELIGQKNGYAYLKLKPKTGRTHQIRVHLKSISRPIVSDALYAPEAELSRDNLGFDRLALHAYMLAFTLLNGEERHFTSPLPLSFIAAEDRIAA